MRAAGFLALMIVALVSLGFFEGFDGAPESPQPYSSLKLATTVHHRNFAGDEGDSESPPPMAAQHGPDCAPPPGTHVITAREQAVFQCRDHIMTAIRGGPYGAIVLTPAALLDWSSGSAVLSWRQSTSRGSGRDWTDQWVCAFGTQFAVPVTQGTGTPDLQGPPPGCVAIVLDMFTDRITAESHVGGEQYRESVPTTFSAVVEPSSTRRDLFELTVTTTTLTLRMPEYGATLLTATRDTPLPFSQAMVQFGHHSYSPEKACPPQRYAPSVGTGGQGCDGTSWHWDEFTLEPSVPLSLLNATPTFWGGAQGTRYFAFGGAAGAGAMMEFSAIGTVALDFGDGRGFQPVAPLSDGDPWHAEMYNVSVPQGATGVDIRLGSGGPYNSLLHVKDVHVWSTSLTPTPTSTVPPPTATASPTPSATPTASPSPFPTASATPSPTSSPAPTPTEQPTATPTPAPTVSPPTPSPTPTPLPDSCERVVRYNGVVMYVDAPLSECAGARP